MLRICNSNELRGGSCIFIVRAERLVERFRDCGGLDRFPRRYYTLDRRYALLLFCRRSGRRFGQPQSLQLGL
jgi:hypothetical protein